MVEEGRACIILNQISPLALTLFGQDNVLGLPLDNGDNQKVRSPVTPQSHLSRLILILLRSGSQPRKERTA